MDHPKVDHKNNWAPDKKAENRTWAARERVAGWIGGKRVGDREERLIGRVDRNRESERERERERERIEIGRERERVE